MMPLTESTRKRAALAMGLLPYGVNDTAYSGSDEMGKNLWGFIETAYISPIKKLSGITYDHRKKVMGLASAVINKILLVKN